MPEPRTSSQSLRAERSKEPGFDDAYREARARLARLQPGEAAPNPDEDTEETLDLLPPAPQRESIHYGDQ